MRVIAVTPAHVGGAELARRQSRYDRFGSAALDIRLHDQPDFAHVPRSFDTPQQIRFAEDCMVERVGDLNLSRPLAPEDVLLPDCVLDTALQRLIDAGLPAQGIMRICVSVLSGLGVRFGAIARNRAVGDALDARIRECDASGGYVGLRVLELPTEAVADTEQWTGALAGHVQALADAGATVVINGCSAVEVTTTRFAATVLDPARLAVQLLGLATELGVLGLASLTPTKENK